MSLSLRSWVALIGRHHRLVLAVSVIVCLLSAASLSRLRLDIDVLGMLPEGRPAFDDFKAFVGDFGRLDELLILVDGGALPRLQRFADDLAPRLAALDTVESVRARINTAAVEEGILGKYLFNYLTVENYGEIREQLSPEGIERQVKADRAILSAPFDLAAARAVRRDPLGWRRLAAASFGAAYGTAAGGRNGYFVADDGRALLLFVRPRASAFDVGLSERLLSGVRAAVADARRALAADDLRVAYTGAAVYALEDATTLRGDVRRYTVLALGGVLVVFYLGYRSLRILPFVTYPLVVTTLLTFSASLLFFEQLNAVSLAFAAILYGLSIDTGIHFHTRLLAERRARPDGDVGEAIAATVQGLARANLAGTTTTAAAFFAIGLSVLSAVRQLGILTATGMIFTAVQFFTLYPALAFFLARRSTAFPVVDTPRLERCTLTVGTHARIAATTAAIGLAALLFIASGVRLDPTLTNLRPRDSEAARVEEEIARRFGRGETSGAILVRRDDPGTALAGAERIAERLRAYRDEGLVGEVQSVDVLLPSAAAQRERLAAFRALPRHEAAESLRAALRRNGFAIEPFADFLATLEAPHGELVRLGDAELEPFAFLIERYVRSTPGGTLVAAYADPAPSVSWRQLAGHLGEDLPDIDFRVAARTHLEDELGRVLKEEVILFAALGLIGNLLLLRLGFGGFTIAAVILSPTVLALVAVFAGMAATGTALDPVNLIVIPLVFGIGVDDGVYIVGAAREKGSVAGAFRSSGRALLMTSLTTIAGFGFLGLSRYPPLASLGSLTAAGLALSFASTLLVLPALLALIRLGRTGQRGD